MLKVSIFTSFFAVFLTVSAFPAQKKFKGYLFEANVIGENYYRFPEIKKKRKTWLQVHEGEEYSIVVHNPLPVRVAVAVTIDGLNTIDGRRTKPKSARKWIIAPYSSITLRGWQTGQSQLRRFYFTDKWDSYAEWKGKRDKKNYTRNLGVIGVAYFWNKKELKAALRPPKPFIKEDEKILSSPKSKKAPSTRNEAPESEDSRAGTGMGERENHHVTEVAFHYDTGMYRTRNVLSIYYEFDRTIARPEPFISEYSTWEFAPEMP